jgi:hypothetical protein
VEQGPTFQRSTSLALQDLLRLNVIHTPKPEALANPWQGRQSARGPSEASLRVGLILAGPLLNL